jgi:vacuolar-type H+-ATPase subunit I/STV1
VVLRLKSPATEQEAVDTALRVLETQLAQVEQQAANVQVTTLSDAEMQQIRRKLEEMMTLVQGQAKAAENLQQGSAALLARQMDELNRKRDALVRQQRELERQIVQTNQALERMKADLRSAQEGAKKR